MRTGVRLLAAGLLAAGLVAVAGSAQAAPQVLSNDQLHEEMRKNRALRIHVKHRGYPDLAQRFPVDSDLPWDNYLVRLIYLGTKKEMGFSRAYHLGRPEIGLLRYRRRLSDALADQTRQYLATAPTATPATAPAADLGGSDWTAGERAEAAAARAEQAATRTEAGAAAAEQAAQRLEDTANRMDTAFKEKLRK